MKRRFLLLALVSCATTGAEGVGDRDLPTSGVGPFRKLDGTEVIGVAPFVFDDRAAQYREPSVLAAGDDVVLFAVATEGARSVIVRSRAVDARTFYGTTGQFGAKPPVVLSPDAPWEGDTLSGPAAIRVGDEVRLYYAAPAGIGLARSRDGGRTFVKEPAPVLTRSEGIAWEGEALHAPSVVVLPDGRFAMFYAASGFLGEARSDDGVHFERVDADPSTSPVDPVLGPAPLPVAPLAPGERPPFDTAGVSDPCALARLDVSGRLVVRVLYTGFDGSGTTTIGFAARFGVQGRLERQSVPVYAVDQKEAAPALYEGKGGVFLYVTQERRIDATRAYTAIAAAFAPGNVRLTTPTEYPDAP